MSHEAWTEVMALLVLACLGIGVMVFHPSAEALNTVGMIATGIVGYVGGGAVKRSGQ